MSNSAPAVNGCATVIAIDLDDVSRFCYPAAEVVCEMLQQVFHVVKLAPYQPCARPFADDFAAQVMSLAHSDRGCEVVFAYFSCHGSEMGLGQRDRPPFFREGDACLFTRAICVLTACSPNATFPGKLLGHPESVRAVLGYAPFLLVPYVAAPESLLASAFENYRQLFLAALVKPVEIIIHGETIQRACDETRQAWGKVGGPSAIDKRVYNVFVTNGMRLAYWPDDVGPATL